MIDFLYTLNTGEQITLKVDKIIDGWGYWEYTSNRGNLYLIPVISKNNSKKSKHYYRTGIQEKTHTNQPIYKKWRDMIDRCRYPKHISYKHYGAKGIKVCEEWLIFDNFVNWSLKSGYHPSLVISRNGDQGDYTPDNCCFKTASENNEERVKRQRKPVCKTSPDSHKILKVYNSSCDTKIDGFNDGHVRNVASGRNCRHTHKGYKWVYVEDLSEEQKSSLNNML
tara:strand:- start:906 stop:1577 length:672 start_codon:yes stop_codon:yes gene_type:complete